MASNTNIQITELDFSNIKNSFIQYLQGQDTFKDYNFQGSALSTILDVLAYNTQYNAYYLNMVANEMFLDSALQRASVVSHAKLLNYTPKSAIAPSATINFTANGVAPNEAFTLPRFTNFLSEAIGGVNYNFVTTESTTINNNNDTSVTFSDIELKQGIPTTYRYVLNTTSNPKALFEIPDATIDTTTLNVFVQQNNANTNYDVYQSASNYLELNSSSLVYFLQESLTGTYEIYFGDGVLGKKLDNDNVIVLSYISTDGTSASGANNFVLMDSIPGMTSSSINPVVAASQGGTKESISSIKFQAPKSYSAQNRAVTKEDYITILQQNTLGISFDAVNVWGGEQNDPPVYGQVFVSLKPSGGYSLTATQKQRLISEVIKPISVLTVEPNIVDPDYTYLNISASVYYDPNKTSQTPLQLESGIKSSITTFAKNNLNTFNSTFSSYDLLSSIQNYSSSIISSDFSIKLQKKFYPNLSSSSSYNLYYGTQLEKSILQSGVTSFPAMQFRDPGNLANIIDGVYIEEVPQLTNGVESISILNPGFSYQYAPTITILGDGSGATAHAIIVSGRISKIVVDSAGSGYTDAIATVTPNVNDTTGQFGSLVVNLEGRYGTLRTYYNNITNVKTILNANAGTIDYINGIITLTNFSPYQINSDLGALTISAKPTTTIISSTYNRIISVDEFDPNSVNVKVIAKSGK
jgi:hypothetical protein